MEKIDGMFYASRNEYNSLFKAIKKHTGINRNEVATDEILKQTSCMINNELPSYLYCELYFNKTEYGVGDIGIDIYLQGELIEDNRRIVVCDDMEL